MAQGSMFANLRLQQLEDNVLRALNLLKDYEDELSLEDDPRRRARFRREIEGIRASKASYQKEYNDILSQLPTNSPQVSAMGDQLREMDTKLDALLAGQVVIQGDISALRLAVLDRFDVSERTTITTIVEHLNQSQLATVQEVLGAMDSGPIPEQELRETLDAAKEALTALKQHGLPLADPGLTSGADQVSEVITAPHLDTRHRLKLTVPIIPLLLSYEGDLALSSGVNLRAAWERLISRAHRNP